MTLKEVINQIRQIVNKALLDLEYEKIEYDVSEPPKTEFGDLTTNIAFLLSKRIHKKPHEIAKEIVSNSINFQIGRASCRERVYMSVVVVSLKIQLSTRGR